MKKIPLTLLTGFLGAGKSTLINRILKEKEGIAFGLIVNEFGDVKLESQIIEASEEDLVELSNGCMCCVVRGDLIKTVQGLLKRKGNKIQHILIEASGLSDPVPIAQTFLADDLEGQIRFDSIICLADTMNFSSSIKDFAVAANQLKYSDFVVLTKTDLAGAEGTQVVREAITALAPKSALYDVQNPDLLDLILDVTQTDHTDLKSLEYEDKARSNIAPLQAQSLHKPQGKPGSKFRKVERVHAIHENVDTLFYKTSQPFDFKRVGKILDNLPSQIVRAKGFLYLNTPEAQFLKVVFQAVGHRHSLDAKPWIPGEEKISALVFIGKDIDKPVLRGLLDSALS